MYGRAGFNNSSFSVRKTELISVSYRSIIVKSCAKAFAFRTLTGAAPMHKLVLLLLTMKQMSSSFSLQKRYLLYEGKQHSNGTINTKYSFPVLTYPTLLKGRSNKHKPYKINRKYLGERSEGQRMRPNKVH